MIPFCKCMFCRHNFSTLVFLGFFDQSKFSRNSRNSHFLLFFSDVSVSDMAFMVVGVLMGVAFLALIFYGLFHKLYA